MAMPLECIATYSKMQQPIHDDITKFSILALHYTFFSLLNLSGLTVIFSLNAHMAAQRGCDKKLFKIVCDSTLAISVVQGQTKYFSKLYTAQYCVCCTCIPSEQFGNDFNTLVSHP